MQISLLIANGLTLIAFFLHTFMGDKELKLIEPVADGVEDNFLKQEKWTIARCAWHWVSFDLLFASVAICLINFTDYIEHEHFLLQILSAYFFGYGLFWLIGLAISKSFPKKYVRLGQWILLWLISGLLYIG